MADFFKSPIFRKNLCMKRLLMIPVLFTLISHTRAQQINYNNYPVYTGNDLGLTYSPTHSTFKIWSPPAEEVQLLFYKTATVSKAVSKVKMKPAGNGAWAAIVSGNLRGIFYTFRVKVNGKWLHDVPDPYAKAVCVNGTRAVVIDMNETNPYEWAKDISPNFSATNAATDAIIYELHVRDAGINDNSGITYKGKFLGLTETGTKNNEGLPTGLDHLKQLGVTHIHLLPSFDFYSVDENQPYKPQYNWGYDPLNYNVPEGSYSTNAADPYTRILQFKELIKTFHSNGLRVVMDVVYNHTMLTEDSYFNQLVPGYYYRQKEDGSFSNATACGNETASERPMMRKFMLESVLYWVKEYHIDGFRFDLMGVHDIATMNMIAAELRKIKPDILLYGEGWTAGASSLPEAQRAIKKNASQLSHIAVFSDDIRDAIKGSVFDAADRGFASGKPGMEESIKFGIVAACKHPQVDYSKVNYSKEPYAAEPWNTITYCECHDNNPLWDKLAISVKDADEETRKQMHELALAIVLTSQGIPFLHAGTEFLRSKKGIENSFNSPDSINAIDWSLKTKNSDVFDLVSYLIKLRKDHPAFRMTTAKQIADNILFLQTPAGSVAYTINGKAAGDKWSKILVAFNGSGTNNTISLPAGEWHTALNNGGMQAMGAAESGSLIMKPGTVVILYGE